MMNKVQIAVKNLTIGYGDFVLLKDLNFNINRGDVFIIMGGSGCGKSSMLRVLTGLVAPQKGTVVIDGTDLPKRRRRCATKSCAVRVFCTRAGRCSAL